MQGLFKDNKNDENSKVSNSGSNIVIHYLFPDGDFMYKRLEGDCAGLMKDVKCKEKIEF